MQDNGGGTVEMLGLPGFRLLAVSERDGELEYPMETTAGWRVLRTPDRLTH